MKNYTLSQIESAWQRAVARSVLGMLGAADLSELLDELDKERTCDPATCIVCNPPSSTEAE